MREWCKWQKQKTATKFGTAREITIAGKTAKIDTVEKECVTYTQHLVFPSSAFVHTNVDVSRFHLNYCT